MPLRELLLIGIVAVLALGAFISARFGLLGYVWFALMRPDVMAWSEGDIPFSMILAICTLLGALRHITDIHYLFRNPFSIGLLLLMIPVLLSIVFALNVKLAWEPFPAFLRGAIAMAILMPILFTKPEHVKLLFLTIALSLGFVGAKMGYFGLLAGGVQYKSGFGGFLTDNNMVGLAMAMTVPLCWFGRTLVQTLWMKAIIIAMMFGCIATVIWTHSRGAMLSLGVGMVFVAFKSKHKVLALVALPLLALPVLLMVQHSYFERMSTIIDYENEGSANSRIVYAKVALQMWADHPVFGVGFGGTNFIEESSKYLLAEGYHVVHNNYLQWLVDSGIFAFGIFLTLFLSSIIWLGRSAKLTKHYLPEWQGIPRGLQCALIVFAVGSAFLSLVKFDIFYYLLMTVGCWFAAERQLLKTKAAADVAQPPKGAGYQTLSPVMEPAAGKKAGNGATRTTASGRQLTRRAQ
jgi:putative inorganic carbon (hco3(-)) transporter